MPLAMASWVTYVALGVSLGANVVLAVVAVIQLRQNRAMTKMTLTAALEGVREGSRLSVLKESKEQLVGELLAMEEACSRVNLLALAPDATLQLLEDGRLEPTWGTELKPILDSFQNSASDLLDFIRVTQERGPALGLSGRTIYALQWCVGMVSWTLTSLSEKSARVGNSRVRVEEYVEWVRRAFDCGKVTSEVLRDSRMLVEAEFRHRLGDDSQPFDGGRWYRAGAAGWSLRPETGDVFKDMPLIDFSDLVEGDAGSGPDESPRGTSGSREEDDDGD